MRLLDCLDRLAWSQAELARRAGIATITVHRALNGKVLTRAMAVKIVNAVSEGLGEKIEPGDIEDLKIEPVVTRIEVVKKKRARKAKES